MSVELMRIVCVLVMVLSALPMGVVGIMSLSSPHRHEYEASLLIGAVLFSGALIGCCILDAATRQRQRP